MERLRGGGATTNDPTAVASRRFVAWILDSLFMAIVILVIHRSGVAFLDEAALLGLTSVRVIHGKGTGALRDATREALKRHPAVGGFERSEQSMGGDGSTEIDLL